MIAELLLALVLVALVWVLLELRALRRLADPGEPVRSQPRRAPWRSDYRPAEGGGASGGASLTGGVQ